MNKEIEEAIERLNGIDIKFFLVGSMEQSNYIIETADKVNKAIEIVLKELKDSTPNSVIRELINTKFKAVFEGDVEIADNATTMNIVKYVKVEDIEEILKEGGK